MTSRCDVNHQVTLSISLTVMSIAMLAGGIMTLRNSEIGLALLRATLLLAIPFDLVRGYFTILITTETSAILTITRNKLLKSQVAVSVHALPETEI